MSEQPIIMTPENRPQPLNVVGEQLTVLLSGAQTGTYEIFLQVGPEGSGPPPHFHPWDEAFYVLKGEVAFGVGDMESVAKAGTLVQVPEGSTHWFRFGNGGGEMLSMTSREGAAAFFTEVSREISPEAPNLPELVRIAESHALTIPVPPMPIN